MSEVISPFSLESAVKYNAKCQYDLPASVLAKYPKLGVPRGEAEFAWCVLTVQKDLGFAEHEKDGKLGWQTYTALLTSLDARNSEYVVFRGNRLPFTVSGDYKLISFDEVGGLDLHRFGNFSARKSEVKAICLHWGGLDAQHCYNVFASNSRQVSSHFLIGLEDEQVVIYQVLDIAHKAWHGGWVNDWTIGVDVCQSPTPSWLDHYQARGYEVSVEANPTRRGPRQLITLDPRLADAAGAFVEDLLAALKMDFIAPESHDVLPRDEADQYTVIGHHHVNERKYDIAPWWSEIFYDGDDEEENA